MTPPEKTALFCPLFFASGSLLMKMMDARELLAEYARSRSDAAFHELVSRFVNLVHSTAVRLVDGDADLAKDVTQNVFVDLSKMAGSLSNEVMIGGWLHRHTCFLASKTMRTERRRKIRERHAMELHSNDDHAAAHFQQMGPVLDDAINHLGSEDRAAILARFFEQRDFRGVGEVIGGSEEAARKRVNRALEKLQAILKRRGITLSTGALAAALSAGAVNAAPVGLAGSIAATAAVTAAAGGGTTLMLLHVMNITKTQIAIVGVIALGLGAPLIMQTRVKARLENENENLKHQAAQVQALTVENQRLSNQLAKATVATRPAAETDKNELLKLRGEVGSLRRTTEDAVASAKAKSDPPSVMSGLTQNPEMAKMIRDQQKMALSMVYKTFAEKTKLPKETSDRLNDMLADHVMTNINHITAMLKEGKTAADMEKVFTAQETELNLDLEKLLGPDQFAKYQDYNQNLLSFLTAEQFKGMLEGDNKVKEERSRELLKAMQEESAKALAAAGLPATYQTVPTLNFRNIALEESGEKNIKLMDSIYENVVNRLGSTWDAKEIEKLNEFRNIAVRNNRLALTVNRKIMAPPNK
jgi:RNA polymerase sigma factor (sigma-70 family)